MFTESANEALLIRNTVSDDRCRALLYQARVNIELFKFSREHLLKAMDNLNHEDFARVVGSCHMIDGIFSSDKHLANQMMYKEQVIGFLLATVTAAHRFISSVKAVRAKERSNDWKKLKYDLSLLENQYHKVRNYMEHLHDSIKSGKLDNGLDCTFTPEHKLTCKDKDNIFHFSFTRDALNKPEEVYLKVLRMLQDREKKVEHDIELVKP